MEGEYDKVYETVYTQASYYATPSPTSNDCDSYFIVWLTILWMYICCNPALRLPYIN